MSETISLGDIPYQAPESPLPEMFPCDVPGCGASYTTLQGVSMHKNRSHGIVSTTRNASRKRETRVGADEAFERVALATKVLFPDPADVYDRLEEIVELRKQMLKVLTR